VRLYQISSTSTLECGSAEERLIVKPGLPRSQPNRGQKADTLHPHPRPDQGPIPDLPLLERARRDQHQTDKDRTNNRHCTIPAEEDLVTPARSEHTEIGR
jgi:hypothetical protein